MRGLAFGFGARISSTVLLIVVCRVGHVEIHRTHYLLDKGDLISGKRIFRVEVLVGPLLGPRLAWNKTVDLSRCMLGWLMEKNQQARESASQVGQDAFSLPL